MAHYDCDNCGARMGISFGLCNSCTPTEFLLLQAQTRDIYCSAERAWDEYIDEQRNAFIEKYLEDNDYDKITKEMKEIEKQCKNKQLS